MMTDKEKCDLYFHIRDLWEEKKRIKHFLNDTIVMKYLAKENASIVLNSRLKEIEEELEKMNIELSTGNYIQQYELF